MRVRINKVYLAPGGSTPMQGLSGSGAPASQRSDPARGSPRFFDRKARSHEMSFGISRAHADLAAAEAFISAHCLELDENAVGTVTLIAEGNSGQPAGSASAAGRLVNYTFAQRGVTTDWTYQIEYGALS